MESYSEHILSGSYVKKCTEKKKSSHQKKQNKKLVFMPLQEKLFHSVFVYKGIKDGLLNLGGHTQSPLAVS